MRAEHLLASPNALAPHYQRFRVDQRILLTGHSHQAWPDCSRAGQIEAWDDAAAEVDRKWSRAFEKADRVRAGFARLLDDPDGDYALGASTHDLVVRLLSALPLDRRPRLVTTDGEFHSARRQFQRLEEVGVEIVRVPASPASTVGDRLAAEIDDRTAAVFTSTVFFRTAEIAAGIPATAAACRRHGAALVLDVYHQLSAVPISLRDLDLDDAFVVGGGYKYCQLGEGNCFLRTPADCRLRPVVTGWFAEFDTLTDGRAPGVQYAEGSGRFAGSTYDPTSHYRAAAVLDFFDLHGLSPELLRRVSQGQLRRLAEGFDALDLAPSLICRDRSVPLDQLGGFLCLQSDRADEWCTRLAHDGIFTDHRDGVLRLGPAPYLSTSQLEDAIAGLGRAVREAAP